MDIHFGGKNRIAFLHFLHIRAKVEKNTPKTETKNRFFVN